MKSIPPKKIDPISESLNLTPLKHEPQITQLYDDVTCENAARDFTYGRENVYNVIETGLGAISTLSDLAHQTQNPRAYEVLGKLMETVINANKDLLGMQQKIREITKPEESHIENNSVTQNLYVGSTKELMELIKKGEKSSS